MRNASLILASAAALTIAGIAQAQDRMPRECRQEIRQLCGTDRSEIRSCLAEKRTELSANCASLLRERLQARKGEQPRAWRPAANTQSGGQEITFGQNALQKADFWTGTQPDAPLVLFVHGGGWKRGDKSMMAGSAKLSHWQAQGYAVASVNYRLVPANTVEDQAADVAASVAYFRANAGQLGIDPERIVLVGHSAGAHLVSLVGTDPQWLAAQGLGVDDVAGVVALDGAGYMVPGQMDENPRLMGNTYQQAFGTDPARQLRLSPAEHTGLPNAPAFLVLHVQRDDAARQSQELTTRLTAAGTGASVIGIDGRGLTGHREINEKLGQADYPATALVDNFLKARFAQ